MDERLRTQKMPLRDKCCQTDHHHHSCCKPVYVQEPGDPPLLQQQLQTSKSGIQQIIECFRSGTKQLKHILLKEVDTIFECKLCRSLFRGLPNLITHKEIYCSSHLKMSEEPPDANDKQSQAIRDLLEAIYPRVDSQEYVIKLEPIETNQNAVFQYITTADDIGHNNGAHSQNEGHGVFTRQSEAFVTVDKNSTSQHSAEHSANEKPVRLHSATEPLKRADNVLSLTCCVCGKVFNSRRGVRRHVRKVHKKRMDELKKCTPEKKSPEETATVKVQSKPVMLTLGRNCPLCHKSFATKANVRRHFDEVHRGLRRDSITPDLATKPGQPLSLGTCSSLKSLSPAGNKKPPSKAEYSLTACKCLLCKRKYSSQIMLKRHMLIVHKISLCLTDPKVEKGPNSANNSTEVKKSEVQVPTVLLEPLPASITNSPQNEFKVTSQICEKKSTLTVQKSKVKTETESPKSTSPPVVVQPKKKPKLAAGFDFKQLYCKLCKRQFTSKQNLSKHIELHTDGNNIYVKFYRCPLCSYETRRKRDVIRHITVVHKKSSRYLGKITANLESRAVKKPIEYVLNRVPRKDELGDEEGICEESKQDSTSDAPPNKTEGADTGVEVKVTKNFSLHKCTCGKAFAKKTYLELHKKSHKTNESSSPEENKIQGRTTRSKTVVW
ncbi:zinc finger protein 800 [Protopterus annectens]|uniref:zinc finger protein 800 n=1 Tax=Protopterus annectens TaxID=7888 RepID=UPI001CFAB1AE|nr:zinc finger protein 800 [Protopterus annectens]XP_043944738.1 zinc finger protein 800 [Protopterus annectens]